MLFTHQSNTYNKARDIKMSTYNFAIAVVWFHSSHQQSACTYHTLNLYVYHTQLLPHVYGKLLFPQIQRNKEILQHPKCLNMMCRYQSVSHTDVHFTVSLSKAASSHRKPAPSRTSYDSFGSQGHDKIHTL